jgi:uncharacterized protein (DUF924 family)
MSETVLSFWFTELTPEQWWVKDETLDQRIRERFSDIHAQAAQCELFTWRRTARGRLAEIIVLDQFSRNLFRDSALAFAHDSLALALAQEAVGSGADQALAAVERSFLYMPYMHSESLVIHEEAVRLFTENGIQNNLDFEFQHKAIIEKFGRYPHRNKILRRESTAEELAFLQQPGSSF